MDASKQLLASPSKGSNKLLASPSKGSKQLLASSSEASKQLLRSFRSLGQSKYNEEGYYTGTCTRDDKDDPAFKTVEEKLINNKTFEKLELTTPDQKDKLTHSLCNPETFKNQYLKLNCIAHNEHIHEKINDELHNLKDVNMESLSKDEQERIFNRLIYQRRNAKKLEVKLFINKIDLSENGFVRSIANKAGFEYGAFHFGLDIDGVILEWGRGLGGQSLVVPTVAVEEFLVHARVNFDELFPKDTIDQIKFAVIHPIDSAARLYQALKDMSIRLVTFGAVSNDQLDKVAKKCVFYNTTFDYDILAHNCQDFINDVLKELNMEFKPQGEFRLFLDRVTQNCNGDFIFKKRKFDSLSELEVYAYNNWGLLEEWDQRLLVCYCDLMDHNYRQTENPKWGPIDEKKWKERVDGLGAKPSKAVIPRPI